MLTRRSTRPRTASRPASGELGVGTNNLGGRTMNNKSDVRELYTETFPLGPAVAEDIKDPTRLSLLFDEKSKLVSKLNHDKSLIIGRKGSGKTTLLESIQILNPSAEVIYLEPSDVFTRIVTEINELSDGVVFVEQISRLWDFILWGVVFNKLVSGNSKEDLFDFCKALGIESEQRPYEVITTMLNSIKSFPPDDWPIPEKIAYKKIANYSFLQAKQIAINKLKQENRQIYLLMDSLENFQLVIPSYSTALSGLLRCLGEFNVRRGDPVILRCCLPAEQYFEYTKLSTNPLKDFRSGLLLHWNAGELIHMCAIRYSRFLKEYHPDFFEKKVQELSFDKREHLQKFWNMIFPYPVLNRLNNEEKPMAYILRHTQLLPRHFIVYLNEVISRSIKLDHKAYDINSGHINSGVFHVESTVRDQVLEAYRTTILSPREACERTLKELKTIFNWSDFSVVAAKVSKTGILGVTDRTELMSLLMEVGAVGRVVGESEKYKEGIFEYMVPHKLIFSDRDIFCIHPVFSEVYNVNKNYEGVKPIYTYWSGITDNDLKEWM